MFCENCGLQFFPRQSVCTRCDATCTRHWLQLTSLATLLIAAVCNSLASMLLPASALAHSAASNRGSSFAPTLKASAIAVWLWIDGRASLYGWAALALALLTWDYFAWPEWRPALEGEDQALGDPLAAGFGIPGANRSVLPALDSATGGTAPDGGQTSPFPYTDVPGVLCRGALGDCCPGRRSPVHECRNS